MSNMNIYNIFFEVPEERRTDTAYTASSVAFGVIGDSLTPAILDELRKCSMKEKREFLNDLRRKRMN